MDEISAEKLAILFKKEWRLKNLYSIKNREMELMRFAPNEAQAHFLRNAGKRNIILKSRRLGFTTLETIDMLDDVLWTPNFDAMLVSYDQDSALEIFDSKILLAWENYREDFKKLYDLDSDRANKLKFHFGNGIFSSIQVRTRGRSGTFNRLHISELGKISRESKLKEREVLSGTIPTVPVGGRIDIESTAEGENGAFYEMFWEAWNRGEPTSPLEFKAHFYNWQWDREEIVKVPFMTDVPKEFKDIQKKNSLTDAETSYYYQKWLSLNKDWNILLQEFPTSPEEAFIFSGTKLFNSEKLKLQKTENGERAGDWIFYQDYKPSHYYGLGADVAEGVGQDSSAIVVIDFTKSKVVAIYRNNRIAPDIFAHEIKRGGRMYGECLVGVERNNHGFTTLVTLKEIYHNIYTEIRKDKETDKDTEKLGWNTTGASKPMMIFELNDAINEQTLEIPSKELIHEMMTYDQTDLSQTRFSAGQTKHWDLLTACFIKGTLILTEGGQKSIETISVGDRVMTRGGYKKVIAASSHLKKVISNIGLTGTPDHPVFCNDNQIKNLSGINGRDILHIWNQKSQKIERLFYTKVFNIIDTRIQNGDSIGFISVAGQNEKKHLFICIEKYGLIISVLSRKVLLFIIKMAILAIISLKTLSFFLVRNISNYICQIRNSKSNSEKILQKTDQKLTMEYCDIIKTKNQKNLFVSFAENLLKPFLKMQNFVRELVGRGIAAIKEKNQNRKKYAQFAAGNLKLGFPIEKDVQKNVSPLEEGSIYQQVFNLQVEDCPEYFANNILVHNCAIAWQMRKEVGLAKYKEKQEKHKEETFDRYSAF